MGKFAWLLLAGFLVLCARVSVGSDACHTSDGTCCSKCYPGYMLIGDRGCGKCKACPPKSYTDQPNDLHYCNRCKRCEGIFQYKELCSPTSNAECECIVGKRCVGENCEQCENIPCSTGQELAGEKCVDCPHGTFNPGIDGPCKPWKRCEHTNVLVNGTRSSDVVCLSDVTKATERATTVTFPVTEATRRPADSAGGMVTIYLIIFVVVCSLLMLPFVKYSVKCLKMMKNQLQKVPIEVRAPEEEEACSCHFPEEEQGNERLTEDA
ncbi:tumor necrosis factor receptor superfamily member 9 [Spea bombifrons]|uniref:tumor necrosis factor receptor superfamily member 9 n=1 Tax=Spea bombifrons TaxID=233779 RepID=UPI00234BCDA0|nr:tumor necrosis factor receptor superfamily member 9 [Spea bombifrons]